MRGGHFILFMPWRYCTVFFFLLLKVVAWEGAPEQINRSNLFNQRISNKTRTDSGNLISNCNWELRIHSVLFSAVFNFFPWYHMRKSNFWVECRIYKQSLFSENPDSMIHWHLFSELILSLKNEIQHRTVFDQKTFYKIGRLWYCSCLKTIWVPFFDEPKIPRYGWKKHN